MRKPIIACIAFLVLLGCLGGKKEIPRPVFEDKREPHARIKDDGDRPSLDEAVENSLVYVRKKMAVKSSGNEDRLMFRRTYESLISFKDILRHSRGDEEFEKAVLRIFDLSEAKGGAAPGPTILTGYYEPVFEGSARPGGGYPYPIYRIPADLIKVKSGSREEAGERVIRYEKGAAVPYYSRREIDTAGVLQGKGYEIAWLKDPLDRFILHVQGSGQIRLPDRTLIRVGYAGSNGRQYRSIGRYLVEKGWLKEGQASLRQIKDFLRRRPGMMEEVLNANERYVFFRPLTHKGGPLGALGVPLVAGRSVATDLTIFPPGALAYLTAQQPVCDASGRVGGRRPLRRFVLNQDTGAAMKGPDRIDFFCGSGERAGAIAGVMKEDARIYFLVRK